MLYGNLTGIKKTELDTLNSFLDVRNKTEFVDVALMEAAAKISSDLNREVSVYISRSGQVLSVGVGDNASVSLPDESKRRGKKRLSGVRVIHTHPNAPSNLSGLDKSALIKQRFDAMAAISVVNGRLLGVSVGYLDGNKVEELRFDSFYRLPHEELIDKIAEAENRSMLDNTSTNKEKPRAMLVCVGNDKKNDSVLEELKSLANTAGLDVVSTFSQNKAVPDKAYYVGSGKLTELKNECQLSDVDVVVFDNQLSGTQTANLSRALGVRVIDRSRLILDIFAARATTNEGKLQVRLAMLEYTLPLLLGQGKDLSRVGGGGGGGMGARRGAGETKLETDRRHIKREIYDLTQKIEKLKRERDMRRENREGKIPTVAIVGYTNAGKSTLMNYLTKAGVLEEDKLFATLDPVTRKFWLDEKRQFLLTDTVGFISRLPHEFIEAFKSTLEEAKYADLLLHVCDSSSEDLFAQYDVVNEVLASLGAGNKPVITVFNKCDLIDKNTVALPTNSDVCFISAKTGEGTERLKKMISSKLF